MTTLSNKLKEYPADYWDFFEYRNKMPIVRYPAVMVAPMQACILKEITSADASVQEVFDPFCGSGTVLNEGKKLGLNVMGFDINPLAALISLVQLEGIPENETPSCITALYSRLALMVGNVEPFSFKSISKWFNEDIILSLSVIRQAILEETNDRVRRFFWCCFAETVKKFSNTRTSTFKLHIKAELQIGNTVDDSIEYFKNHIQSNYAKLLIKNKTRVCIKCGDSEVLLKSVPDNSIDLICTSPPYGDNHTTVTYGQFSILPLLWIDKRDLMIWDESLLETLTAIDSLSLGGKTKREQKSENTYDEYVNGVSKDKQKKVLSFFADYENVFKLLASKLKPGKLIVLTLGNRRVDNTEIRFDVFNDKLASKYGLELDSTITRNIVGKRMPCKVSNIKTQGAVKSISKEYVKIYMKRSDTNG